MTRSAPLPRRGVTGGRWLPILACLSALVGGACRGDGGTTRVTVTPAPTLFVATASPAGIANPPRTAQPGGDTSARGRAEAFLRRVVLTEADLPPLLTFKAGDFLDGNALAARASNEAYNRAQWEATGLVLSLQSGFEGPQPPAGTGDGSLRRVSSTAFAFQTADGAQTLVDQSSGAPSLEPSLSGRATGITTQRIDELQLGESSKAWRASGAAVTDPTIQLVVWSIVLRRGPCVLVLNVEGTGPLAERTARDLAQRLDQRLAAALAAGVWP